MPWLLYRAWLFDLRLMPDRRFYLARLLDPWFRMCRLVVIVNLRPCMLRPLNLLLSWGHRPMDFMAGQRAGFLYLGRIQDWLPAFFTLRSMGAQRLCRFVERGRFWFACMLC